MGASALGVLVCINVSNMYKVYACVLMHDSFESYLYLLA